MNSNWIYVIQAYNNNSSVERFKARLYLQQLSKVIHSLDNSLNCTQRELRASTVHETTEINRYDKSKNEFISLYN